MRLIIVSDVHGCIEEFDELLNKVQYNKNTDRLILLGDLIDRGPDSTAVVRRARELDGECVMGNHEFRYLRWYKGNQKILEGKPHYSELSDDDAAYINRMPYHIKLSDTLYVLHAGVKPGVPIERQRRDDLLYLRYTDKDRNFISLRKVHEGCSDAMFWTDFWYGPESIIYGHNVHDMENPKIEERIPGVTCYGLDTGCCFGGRLTAMVIDGDKKEIVQVQAKQIYYKSGFD